MADPSFARGSLWNRWDLHFHTPSSFDYENGSVTDAGIVERLVSERVRVVAVTDHHTMDVARIRNLADLGKNHLTVLPGIELRSELGGHPIHYILIFPESCDLDDVWATIKGKLQLTAAGIAGKGGDDKVYVPIKDGATLARELGGVVSIHAGSKSNSIEEIKNEQQFQQRIKYDITRQWVDLMEIGQLKDIDSYWEKVFPKIGLEKPLLICSDNHDVEAYEVKAPMWLRADPTFRGLLMAILEPRDRIFLGDRPQLLDRVSQNPTKFIRSITYARRPSAPPGELWFDGGIDLNPGLVAIVGNKGGGKSALSDTVGLAGSTRNHEDFSFLSKARFRHPKSKLADAFEATVVWESGEAVTRRLSEEVRREEVERVKYLPQDHVEKVCTALSVAGGEEFEKELKEVIFSRVPDELRLGSASLDSLVAFRTEETQARIDTLVKQLKSKNRIRAAYENRAAPQVRKDLVEKLHRREIDIAAHDQTKPPIVEDPAIGEETTAKGAELAAKLAAVELARIAAQEEAENARQQLSAGERRVAVAKRLLERLGNLRKEVEASLKELFNDAGELGLDHATLVDLTINDQNVRSLLLAAEAEVQALRARLDASSPTSPVTKLATVESLLVELRAQLDAPNREYQNYLASLRTWEVARQQLVGAAEVADSLEGLKAELLSLDELPSLVEASRTEQMSLALEIHQEKLALVKVYRELYGPVQEFITSHSIAESKLALDFSADLLAEGFVDRVLARLAQNRRGSFMGVDDGRQRLLELVQVTDWQSSESVRHFLESVDRALHFDLRPEQGEAPVLLVDQLAKGASPEEVFELLYSLDFVRPRYLLRWDGKDLAMLSAGERGTLLLVFYLLIDQSDLPLVIDQPEGNLDNHTVSKVLVDCIREARKRRQVLIVTHNPNLAVVCDADQVIHASIDKTKGNVVTYTTGSLENPEMSRFVTDVLEGTRWAFRVRGDKYNVGQGQEA